MRSKKAIKNILSNLVLQIVFLAYGFIVRKIIISTFGSNINGLISSITQFLAYIALLESGFGPVVKSMFYKPIANDDKEQIKSIIKETDKFFKRLSIVFIIYIIVLCIFYPLIVAKDFDYIYTISLIIIISISTFTEYFFGMTYKIYLQSKQLNYVISITQIVTYILSIVSIFIMVKIGVNIHLLKLITGVIFIIRPLFLNYYAKSKFDIKFDQTTKKIDIKQKWDGLAQHIASVIHGNTDITILTIFSTLKEVSVYSTYSLIITGIKQIIQSFNSGIDSTFGDIIARGEKNNINVKFSSYETLYYTITTIIFSCTLVLITPFISVFTKGIADANYNRYFFGILLVISEYIWAIRLPYSSLTMSAGHFKETKKGAWLECIINIAVSIILVKKFGIVGVAFGTITAMLIRTIEFINHSNKKILFRSNLYSVKKVLVIFVETVLIYLVTYKINFIKIDNYLIWFGCSVFVFCISTIIVLIINVISYYKEIPEILLMIQRIIKREKKI